MLAKPTHDTPPFIVFAHMARKCIIVPDGLTPQRNVKLGFCAVFVFWVAAYSASQHRFHQLCIARLRGVHGGSSSAKCFCQIGSSTDRRAVLPLTALVDFLASSFAAYRLGHPSQQQWIPHGASEGYAPAARCPSARMLRGRAYCVDEIHTKAYFSSKTRDCVKAKLHVKIQG